MPRIEGFSIRNYKVLRDVTLGKYLDFQPEAPLSALTAVIGKNGAGKSTLFDALGFLRDMLVVGVEEACDSRQRGGLDRLISAGTSGPIWFGIQYVEEEGSPILRYSVTIGKDTAGRAFVEEERLAHFQQAQETPHPFLFVESGEGVAWSGTDAEEEAPSKVNLTDNRKLAIATLGGLRDHPRIARFREFLEGWYLSYFTPDAARGMPMAGPQKHLSMNGDNLGNVVEYLRRDHPDKFHHILRRIAERIPGVSSIDTKRTDDGRLLLRFNDSSFQDPFYAQQVSDGTLKLFAYLLLLEDPDPAPLICIEEPENGLYHKLLDVLAHEMRAHASTSQVLVTTHQPYFVNALTPDEVWVIEKQKDGFATVRRASSDPLIQGMVAEGIPLGSLWYSDYLDR